MPNTSAAVLDTLNSLLEAEQNSICRLMGEGSPYLAKAPDDVRRPLAGMAEANARHCAQLAEIVSRLGGRPSPGPTEPEEKYLTHLSLKFLLPKIVDSKGLTIKRYENAMKALPKAAPREAVELLKGHNAEHRAQLEVLEKAAAEVIAAGK